MCAADSQRECKHVIVVHIGLTLWSGRLPPQLYLTLAYMLHYQNWKKLIRDESYADRQSGEDIQLSIRTDRATKTQNDSQKYDSQK